MNQKELIDWLKPVGFNPQVHVIIKSQFKGFCQICSKKYSFGEFVTYNPEKKKVRHIDCKDPKIKNRKKNTWGPTVVKK